MLDVYVLGLPVKMILLRLQNNTINRAFCLSWIAGPNKHQSAVTCLQFNSKFVITSSDDGTVKLWDVKTGEKESQSNNP